MTVYTTAHRRVTTIGTFLAFVACQEIASHIADFALVHINRTATHLGSRAQLLFHFIAPLENRRWDLIAAINILVNTTQPTLSLQRDRFPFAFIEAMRFTQLFVNAAFFADANLRAHAQMAHRDLLFHCVHTLPIGFEHLGVNGWLAIANVNLGFDAQLFFR